MHSQDTASVRIFAYVDDESQQAFWVAYTEWLLDDLLPYRMEQARNGRLPSQALQEAIEPLLSAGRRPSFHLLEEVPVDQMRATKMYWIGRLLDAGHPLANPEVRKIREAREKALYSWPDAPEECRNIYVVEDPRTGKPHHVASTKNGASQAISALCWFKRRNSSDPDAVWIKSLAKDGVKPRARLLEIVGRSEASERRVYWAHELGVIGGTRPHRASAAAKARRAGRTG